MRIESRFPRKDAKVAKTQRRLVSPTVFLFASLRELLMELPAKKDRKLFEVAADNANSAGWACNAGLRTV